MVEDRIIYKYHVSIGSNFLDLPAGSEVLTIERQYNSAVVYVVQPVEFSGRDYVNIELVGTGAQFNFPSARYIGTVLLNNDNFVLHAFEVR